MFCAVHLVVVVSSGVGFVSRKGGSTSGAKRDVCRTVVAKTIDTVVWRNPFSVGSD